MVVVHIIWHLPMVLCECLFAWLCTGGWVCLFGWLLSWKIEENVLSLMNKLFYGCNVQLPMLTMFQHITAHWLLSSRIHTVCCSAVDVQFQYIVSCTAHATFSMDLFVGKFYGDLLQTKCLLGMIVSCVWAPSTHCVHVANDGWRKWTKSLIMESVNTFMFAWSLILTVENLRQCLIRKFSPDKREKHTEGKRIKSERRRKGTEIKQQVRKFSYNGLEIWWWWLSTKLSPHK